MKKVNVADIKFNIAMLCAYMSMTTDQLADASCIERNRLNSIRAGRTKMSGEDLIGLSDATGIPVENIQTLKDMQ